jgi:succinoglycan biosynthesis protein ExoW
VAAQTVTAKTSIRIIIVDDGSPWPAAEELSKVEIPQHVKIELVRRDNGGPGAARNTGLDKVTSDTDFIAFIDSDDVWRNDHLGRALSALTACGDLYFADHLQWGGKTKNSETKEFGTFIRASPPLTRQHVETVRNVMLFPNADVIIPYAVKDFIAHTSSIVYRRRNFTTCRFDETLWYGEDDLFLLDLLLTSTGICVSTEPEVELGFGDNLFVNSWSWDSANHLTRCVYQYVAHGAMLRRPQLKAEHHELVRSVMRSWQPALTFFIVKHLLRRRQIPRKLVSLLFRNDPFFLFSFPVNAARGIVQWVTGKATGKVRFDLY